LTNIVATAAASMDAERCTIVLETIRHRPTGRIVTFCLVTLCAALLLAGCKTTPVDPEPYIPVHYPLGISFEGKIQSDFGDTWKRRRPHRGIDIAGHHRQPIIAIVDGIAMGAEYDPCAGIGLRIHHGRDLEGKPLFAWYLHIGGSLVERGQHVKRGDLVAWLDGPPPDRRCGSRRHLHLELARGTDWNSPAVNPHLLWADGPYRVTCFEPGREYAKGTITYPILCDMQVHTLESLLESLSNDNPLEDAEISENGTIIDNGGDL